MTGHVQMVLLPLLSALRPQLCKCTATQNARPPRWRAACSPVFLPQSLQTLAGVASFNAVRSKTWQCRVIRPPCGRHVHMGALCCTTRVGDWLDFLADDKA
uniref:Secreted protein n=1 Tax=Setaria italica TaxID=4555 RepID=K3Y3T9_SETIT